MSQPVFYWAKQSATAVYSATDTLDGTSVDNIQFATEDTGWKPANISGTKAVEIDNGVAITLDAVLLLGENMDGINLAIRASDDNFAASNVSISTTAALSSDVNAAIREFSSATYRYWRFNFSSFGSDFELQHLALDLQSLLTFFEIDPDEDGLDPTAGHLISKAGLYLGTWQDKTMTDMVLDFGEITPAEDVALQAWATANVETVNPFFVQVDSSVSRVHFGYLQNGGSWHAPLVTGVQVTKSNTFIKRDK